MTFDTLDYARRLRAASVPQEQAEAMAQALQAAFAAPHGAASRADIAAARSDIAAVHSDLASDIARLENRIAAVESELALHRWLFGIMVAIQAATLAGVIAILLR